MQQRPDVQLLSLKGAELLKQSPYIFTISSNGTEEKTTFYVLLESVRPDDQRICEVATEILKVLLSRSKGSVTASLSAIIKETHQRLCHFNSQRSASERTGLGITCVAVRNNDVFIGSAGPSFANLMENGKLRQITNPKEGGLSSLSGIGTGGKAAVQLFYHTLKPNDSVFIATSSLRRMISTKGLNALLAQEREDYQNSLGQLARTLPGLSCIRLDIPSGTAKKKKGIPTEEILIKAKAIVPSRPKISVPATKQRTAGHAPRKNTGFAIQRPKLATIQSYLRVYLPTKNVRTDEESDTAAKPITSQKPQKSMATKPSPVLRKLRLPLLAFTVILALLIGVQILFLLPSISNKRAEDAFGITLKRAQVSYETAMDRDDRAERRVLLREAEKLVSEALAIRNNDARAMSLQQTLTSDLRRLDAVYDLPGIKVLEDYSRIGSGSSVLARMTVSDDTLYLLDRGTDRVYSSKMNTARSSIIPDSTKIVLKKDDKIEGTYVGAITSLLWMPQGGSRSTGNLLVFDDRSNVYEHKSEKNFTLLRVRGTNEWSSFKGALGYNGNLYVLDPRASQVWRYIPTATGYDSERRGILENATIPEALDIAIDGGVYILGSNGTIWKFIEGIQQRFSQAGLDKPLQNPTSLYTSATARYIYVVDSGNRRIVLFNKNGTFYRQYTNEAFDNLRGVYADEEKARMYILNGKKVYLATIPK